MSDVDIELKTNLDEIRSQALRYLARREYCYWELLHKLKNKNFDLQQIEVSLSRLIEEDLLSEDRFVEMYVSARVSRGFGPIRIVSELKEKRIDKSLIERYVHRGEIPWDAVISQVFSKKYGANYEFTSLNKRKCWQFLQYKGFSIDQIKSVVC